MSLLSQVDIDNHLVNLPRWRQDGSVLRSTWTFTNFVEAIAFVNRLVEPAEAANHHPDISIYGYNKVEIVLTTHDRGGLTQKDFDLAATITGLA